MLGIWVGYTQGFGRVPEEERGAESFQVGGNLVWCGGVEGGCFAKRSLRLSPFDICRVRSNRFAEDEGGGVVELEFGGIFEVGFGGVQDHEEEVGLEELKEGVAFEDDVDGRGSRSVRFGCRFVAMRPTSSSAARRSGMPSARKPCLVRSQKLRCAPAARKRELSVPVLASCSQSIAQMCSSGAQSQSWPFCAQTP